jgi:hypothetical protein
MNAIRWFAPSFVVQAPVSYRNCTRRRGDIDAAKVERLCKVRVRSGPKVANRRPLMRPLVICNNKLTA